MKMGEILRRKGHDVVTITEDRSILDAVRTLVRHDIGSLMVMRGDRPTGIITERDILRTTADSADDLGKIPVSQVMTRDLIVATPDDDLREKMTVMTEQRIRHLPVIEDDELVGIVSIGDLLNACRTVAEDENAHLKRYIRSGG